MRIPLPFVLIVCAIFCMIGSLIHHVGWDILAVGAVIFIILAAVLKYVGQQLTKAKNK